MSTPITETAGELQQHEFSSRDAATEMEIPHISVIRICEGDSMNIAIMASAL